MPKTRLRARQTYLSGAMSASRELQRQLRRIEPCLRPATKLPAGWIHEIKHDGYRIMAERDHGSVKLYSRNGYDFAERFPLAAAAIRKLPVRSCLIDGEAIVCDANGLAVFDLLRRWSGDDVVLCAFDLLELDGHDLRRAPIEERKATLAKLLRRPVDGNAFNEHYSGDGAIIYKHACVWASMLGHTVDIVAAKHPSDDVSPHVHILVCRLGGINEGTNDKRSFPSDGSAPIEFRMPDVAATYSDFVRKCRALGSGAEAAVA